MSLPQCPMPSLQEYWSHFKYLLKRKGLTKLPRSPARCPVSCLCYKQTTNISIQREVPSVTNKHFKLREILHAFKNFPVCYTITTIPSNTFYTYVSYIHFLFIHFLKKQAKSHQKNDRFMKTPKLIYAAALLV